MKKLRRAVSLLIAVAMTVVFAGCQKEITAENLMENVTTTNVPEKLCDDDFAETYDTFAFKLLKSLYSEDGGNVVVSPLTVAMTTSMVANGADGMTLNEMKNLLGRPMNISDLNVYLHTYKDRLSDTEQAKLYYETALWFNSDKKCTPTNEFLENVANYYGADAYKESFSSAVENINNWISNKTTQKIEYIVEEISSDAPMCVVNTTDFEADWAKPYSYDQVKDGTFTDVSGNEKNTQMMSSFEYIYLEDDMGMGFIKYYSGENYAFIALRPDDYVSLGDYIDHLAVGGKLKYMLKWQKQEVVSATIPKFECEYSGGLADTLTSLGVGRAFDSENAELSNIGTSDDNLYVDDIYTRTILRVTEKGTSKGTAASIGSSNDTAAKTHVITLDRPFVYMVVDCDNYLPIIIGAVNTIEE